MIWGDKKEMVKKILFTVVSIIFLLIVYFFAMNVVETKNNEERFKENIGIDYNVAVEIEAINSSENTIIMNGWIIKANSINRGINVALRETESNAVISVKAMLHNRPDIKDYYGISSDFGKCGFEVSFSSDKIDSNKVYEILVAMKYTDIAKDISNNFNYVKRVTTRQYLYDGELYDYNPTEYYAPEVTNKEFYHAMAQGRLCAFDKDIEAWIYEYDKKLYMIVNDEMFAESTQGFKVPIFIYSSNLDKLLLDEGVGRKDFSITQNYFDNKDGKYILMMVDMSDVQYPITSIKTGIYGGSEDNKEWKWIAEFRPKWQ